MHSKYKYNFKAKRSIPHALINITVYCFFNRTNYFDIYMFHDIKKKKIYIHTHLLTTDRLQVRVLFGVA